VLCCRGSRVRVPDATAQLRARCLYRSHCLVMKTTPSSCRIGPPVQVYVYRHDVVYALRVVRLNGGSNLPQPTLQRQ